MKSATALKRGGGYLLAGAVALASVIATSADAAPAWLKGAFGKHSHVPQAQNNIVARYHIDAGGAFILDRSSPRTLLKFDDSPEVWVLGGSHGPRGDMIYTSDLGRPLVRVTHMGGTTVFTPERPDGSAASEVGAAAPLRLTTLGPGGLYHVLIQSSARASKAARHLIGFEAPDADPTSDGLIADAAVVASEAVIALSTDSDNRPILSRVTRVEILRGGQPGASLRGNVVNITVVPPLGVAGRPSSQRILFAMGVR